MPNWCNNGITLRHADPQMIQRVMLGRANLFQELIPCPQDLLSTLAGSFGDEAQQAALIAKEKANVEKHGYANWYDYCVNEWGTKWDIALDCVENPDANTVTASFESAWAPPIGAYEKLMALGFEIEAFYYEPGMCFVGKWQDGEDECIEYGGATADTVRDMIGAELDDYFGISEEMAQYDEENEE
jgi:hypothetical protein